MYDPLRKKYPIERGAANSESGDWVRFKPQIVPLVAPMLITSGETEIGYEPMSVRILVVDDHGPIRDGLRLLLENHPNWEVCGEAASGVEAIEQYRQLKPDLLVVDVSMPLMNGFDASLEILKLSPTILILLYTSYLTAQLVEEAHRAGIGGQFPKTLCIW